MPCNPINPATGLPMTEDGYCGVDVAGSPYGIDIHADINSAVGFLMNDEEWEVGISVGFYSADSQADFNFSAGNDCSWTDYSS